MPKFSLDAKGGYARGKATQMPRPLSLAQAPPEVRNQMLLGSARGRLRKIGPVLPPSPPTILDSDLLEEEGGKVTKEVGSAVAGASPPDAGTRSRTDGKPPETPVRLEERKKKTDERSSSRRPHERFLAKAGLPPPPDSNTGYIAVSTHPTHYEIIVRLQGVSLNSITLSTRRRRVLHIAADCYADGDLAAHPSGGGGGHWERRIGFGWDADLTAVRAEFDGRFLKVIVPRKDGDGA